MSGYALDYRLVHGTRPGGLDVLAAGWTHRDYLVRLERMAGFAAAPSLTAKLRGGMGAVLLDSASAAFASRDRCNWKHESAAEYFFGERPRIRLGSVSNQICTPFTLSAHDDGAGALLICLRLFGLAAERGEAALLALLTAIRHRVDWKGLQRDAHVSLPQPIDIGGVERHDFAGIEVTSSVFPVSAEIIFTSPVNLGQGANQSLAELFWGRLLARLSLIAPWMGIDLLAAGAAAEAIPEALTQDGYRQLAEDSSQAGGFRRKAVLVKPDPIKLLFSHQSQLTAATIGEIGGIGRAATLGLGRYIVVREQTPAD